MKDAMYYPFEAFLSVREQLTCATDNDKLLNASYNNSTAKAVRLLDRGASPTYHGRHNWAAIHWAAKNGNQELIRLMHEKDRVCINMGAITGFYIFTPTILTPLLIAAKEGDTATTLLLIDLGATVSQTDWCKSAIYYALSSGHIDTADALIARNVFTEAFLDLGLIDAAKYNRRSISTYLLNHGASPVRCDAGGWAPIHYAVRYGYLDFIQDLINSNPACVNTRSRSGLRNGNQTPLHIAILYRPARNVLLKLIQNNPDLEAEDQNGKTPIQLACMIKDMPLEVVETLVEAGANFNRRSSKHYNGLANGLVGAAKLLSATSVIGPLALTPVGQAGLAIAGSPLSLLNQPKAEYPDSEKYPVELALAAENAEIARYLLNHPNCEADIRERFINNLPNNRRNL